MRLLLLPPLPPLRLEQDPGSGSGSGIIFSPGGSQAYMFTEAPAAVADPAATTLSQTPREIRDPIFLERQRHDPILRRPPTTLGSSEDPVTLPHVQQQHSNRNQ